MPALRFSAERVVVLAALLFVAACDAPLATPLEAAAPSAAIEAGASPHSTLIVDLGERIFNDSLLSIGRNQSCASCHDAAFGFTAPVSSVNAHGAVMPGSIAGRFGNRRPPSAAYAAFSPVLAYNDADEVWVGGNFWDGRATGARLGSPSAEQALGPFVNPVEQALPDKACVVYLVSQGRYGALYRSVWGGSVGQIRFPNAGTMKGLCSTEGSRVPLSRPDREQMLAEYDRIGLSVAAFEASPRMSPFNSRFDAMHNGGPRLTREEMSGLELYMGKAQCAACHPIAGRQPLLTDFTFDNLGVPPNPENPALLASGFVDLGLGGFLRDPSFDGAQKVPTLRNLTKRRSPLDVRSYMHNGVFKSLEQVVHFYNTRDVLATCPAGVGPYDPRFGTTCWPAPEVPYNVNVDELGNLGLTPAEERLLVAFLRTLDDR